MPDKPKTTPEILAYLRSIAERGGVAGGPARAAKLSPKRRSAIARRAALARWRK